MNTKRLKRTIAFIISQYFVLVAAGIVVIIGGVGYLVFIHGTVTDIQQAGQTDLQAQLQAYEDRRITLGRLEDLSAQYNELTAIQLHQLDSVIPTESELPQIMIELKNFVSQHRLNLVSLDTGPLKAVKSSDSVSQTVKTLNITLTIDGIASYFQFKDFLDSISTQLPLMELHSISYVPSETSYGLNLTLYYK